MSYAQLCRLRPSCGRVGLERATVDGIDCTSVLWSEPPAPGEGIVGYLHRIAAANLERSVPRLASRVGVRTLTAAPLATRHAHAAARLAFLCKIDERDVLSRMYCGPNHVPGRTIDFFGMPVREAYREAMVARVAPRRLAVHPYRLAAWDLRPLGFCPETLERLLDECPQCRRPLGWDRTFGPLHCGYCRSPRGLPTVDLRDYPRDVAEVDDVTALRFVCDLVSYDPDTRSRAMRQVPPPLDGLGAGNVFEAVVALACALATPSDRSVTTLWRPKSRASYRGLSAERLSAAGRAIIGWPDALAPVADSIRQLMHVRSGHYGIIKELGPLRSICHDRNVDEGFRRRLSVLLAQDMDRSKWELPTVRRTEKWRREGLITAFAAAKKYGIPPRLFKRLAGRDDVTSIRQAGAVRSPTLFVEGEIAAIAAARMGLIPESTVARAIGVPGAGLADLAAAGCILRASGPVLELMRHDRYWLGSSIHRFVSRVSARVDEGAAPRGALPLTKAMERIGLRPDDVPWATVFQAVLDGQLQVWHRDGRLSGLAQSLDVMNLAGLKQIADTAGAPEPPSPDDRITLREAAEMIGTSAALVADLVADGFLAATDHTFLKLRRGPVREFVRRCILTTEVAARMECRYRDVRSLLAERGVLPRVLSGPRGQLVWLRSEVAGALKFGAR